MNHDVMESIQFSNYIDSIYRISSKAKTELDKVCSIATFKKNELIQPVGHTCKTIYFLQKGIARIFYYKDGVDITEYFAFEGGIVARAESLFAGEPSQKAIEVLEDSEVLAIDVPKLYQLYDEFHEIERLFRLIFEKAHVETIHRIESLQFHSAEERYLNLLSTQKNIIHYVPLKHIASYLGITQVSLSRIRAKVGY
jgi:CRP-like cAMP-binding protein